MRKLLIIGILVAAVVAVLMAQLRPQPPKKEKDWLLGKPAGSETTEVRGG